MTIACPSEEGKNMAIEVREPQVSITTDVSGSVPTFRVKVNTSGWITEQDCITEDYTEHELIVYAERAYAEKIARIIRQALDVLQHDMKVDGVRFGYVLHRQHPNWWRQHSEEWDSIFPRVVTSIDVTTKIPQTGLFVRPMNFRVP